MFETSLTNGSKKTDTRARMKSGPLEKTVEKSGPCTNKKKIKMGDKSCGVGAQLWKNQARWTKPQKKTRVWSWGPTVVMRKWVGEEAAKSGTHSTIRWAHNDTCEGTQLMPLVSAARAVTNRNIWD